MAKKKNSESTIQPIKTDEDSEPKILEKETTRMSYKPNACRFCAGSKFC